MSRSTDAPPPILSLAGPHLPGAIYGKLWMQNVNCQMFNDSILWFWQSDSNKIRINTFEFQKNILQHLWFCQNLWPPVDDAHSAPLVDSIVHAAMKRPGACQFGRQRQRWIHVNFMISSCKIRQSQSTNCSNCWHRFGLASLIHVLMLCYSHHWLIANDQKLHEKYNTFAYICTASLLTHPLSNPKWP